MFRRETTITALLMSLSIAPLALGAQAEIRQLNWIMPDGSTLNGSRVGELELHFDAADPQDHQFLVNDDNAGGAYVNMMIANPDTGDTDWAVRNWFIAYPDPLHMADSSPSVQFALPGPEGMIWNQAEVAIQITPMPLENPKPLFQPSPVFQKDYQAGGLVDGGSAWASTPFFIQPFIGVPNFPTKLAWTHTAGDKLPKVDEEKEGCAPASAARSIEYLGDTNDFETDDAQDIYDDLKDDMGTTVGEEGEGTSVADFLSGKNAYTAENGLPIDTVQKFGISELDAIMDLINNGADVEIMIKWNPKGGHAAMITSIIKMADGSYYITYVDDPTQGDGVAENEEHTIHVKPDGTFEGGSIIGFQIETVRTPDLDGDGDVDSADLLQMLAEWGTCENCSADLDGDGDVDFSDVLELLAEWG